MATSGRDVEAAQIKRSRTRRSHHGAVRVLHLSTCLSRGILVLLGILLLSDLLLLPTDWLLRSLQLTGELLVPCSLLHLRSGDHTVAVSVDLVEQALPLRRWCCIGGRSAVRS